MKRTQSKKYSRNSSFPKTNLERTVEWTGSIDQEMSNKISSKIKTLIRKDPHQNINLIITSPGGPTGVGMSFYDLMTKVIRPNLCTIGSGDVDSAAIIVFLAGQKRILTKNTTLLLHKAGRTFNSSKRFTTTEISSILKEDTLKDNQYAALLAQASKGKLSHARALRFMEKGMVLEPKEALRFGLADQII
ncbi:MAG: ATP-dependent Clp protease proteolytic subunit [bacterium]|nr:ATP-dependent Clp protease proteolytic subunit [bacterium]